MTLWPTKYRIRSRIWKIRYLPKDAPELVEEDGDYLLGCCHADKRLICICTDQSAQSMADTLWHELTHACYSTSPMAGTVEDPEDGEERIVLFSTEAAFEILRNAKTAWWDAADK